MSGIEPSLEIDDAAWMADRMRSANAGAGVSTAMAYLAQALSLVTVPLYLKYLGQEQYGLMLLLVTLQTYLAQTNLGLNWAATNIVGAARASGDARELVVVVQNALLLATITAVVALAASGAIAFASRYGLAELLKIDEGVNPWAIIATGGLAALSLAGGPVYATFIGMGESSITAFYHGLGRLLSIPVMAAVAWSGGGIAAMFGVNALILLVILAVASVHLARRYPAIVLARGCLSRQQCELQLRTGLKNIGAELGYLLHASAPTLALGATCGAATVPLYTIPKTLFETALTFGRTQYSVLQPAYAEAASHGRTSAMARMLSRSITRNVQTLAVLCAGFIVLCDPFVRLWTSNRVEVPQVTALAIASGSSALFLLQLIQLFLVAANRQFLVARVLVATGASLLAAAVVMGAAAGFLGVLFVAAGLEAITVAGLGAQAWKHLGRPLPLGRATRLCASVGAAFGITLVVGLALQSVIQTAMGPAMSIAIVGLTMVVSYGLCMSWLAPGAGTSGVAALANQWRSQRLRKDDHV